MHLQLQCESVFFRFFFLLRAIRGLLAHAHLEREVQYLLVRILPNVILFCPNKTEIMLFFGIKHCLNDIYGFFRAILKICIIS